MISTTGVIVRYLPEDQTELNLRNGMVTLSVRDAGTSWVDYKIGVDLVHYKDFLTEPEAVKE